MLKLGSRTPAWLGLLLGTLAGVLPAGAAPFTCTTFKERLAEALVEAADPGAEAPAYKEARATDKGGSHLNWDTSALSGSLSCKSGDLFGEFYVSLNVTSRDRFVEQLQRLVSLDGAAVCTLAQSTPSACADAGKLILQEGLDKMGAEVRRKVGSPSGLSDRMLWPDIKAEVTTAPSLLTFSFAAADGATPQAERRPLDVRPPAPMPLPADPPAP